MLQFLGPEIARILQFLGPEIAVMLERSYIPLLLGAVVHLIWGDKGVPRLSVRTKVVFYGLFICDIPALSTILEANRKVEQESDSRAS